ncbi:hypothetical protein Mapa_000734 [Marchantia paleacea]|nr:hypothetical protein Mapa_000734 [Marchantia paleacea]
MWGCPQTAPPRLLQLRTENKIRNGAFAAMHSFRPPAPPPIDGVGPPLLLLLFINFTSSPALPNLPPSHSPRKPSAEREARRGEAPGGRWHHAAAAVARRRQFSWATVAFIDSHDRQFPSLMPSRSRSGLYSEARFALWVPLLWLLLLPRVVILEPGEEAGGNVEYMAALQQIIAGVGGLRNQSLCCGTQV